MMACIQVNGQARVEAWYRACLWPLVLDDEAIDHLLAAMRTAASAEAKPVQAAVAIAQRASKVVSSSSCAKSPPRCPGLLVWVKAIGAPDERTEPQ